MNQLTLDRSPWLVLANNDGTYRVASEGTRKVIAPSVTLSLGAQIVDEHAIALRVYKAWDFLPNPLPTLTDVDGTVYQRLWPMAAA